MHVVALAASAPADAVSTSEGKAGRVVRGREGGRGGGGVCRQADLRIFVALLQFCSHQAQLMHIGTVSPLGDHLHRLAHEESCVLGPYLPPEKNAHT